MKNKSTASAKKPAIVVKDLKAKKSPKGGANTYSGATTVSAGTIVKVGQGTLTLGH
jgi:autotransporter-like protein